MGAVAQPVGRLGRRPTATTVASTWQVRACVQRADIAGIRHDQHGAATVRGRDRSAAAASMANGSSCGWQIQLAAPSLRHGR